MNAMDAGNPPRPPVVGGHHSPGPDRRDRSGPGLPQAPRQAAAGPPGRLQLRAVPGVGGHRQRHRGERTVNAGLVVTAAVAVVAGTGLYLATGSRIPERPAGAHRPCGLCRTESRVAPWKRRAMQARQPGPGWPARVRYALTEGEYRERRRSGCRWPTRTG